MIVLGVIIAVTASRERFQRVPPVAGAGLVAVVVAHVLAALSYGKWAPGEMAASAGPYLALVVGLAAVLRISRPIGARRNKASTGPGRPRWVVTAFSAVGALLLLVGLSMPEFFYWVNAFGVNGFASLGVGVFEESPWPISIGTLIIVGMAARLLVAIPRHRDVLRGARVGAALSLVVLAGPGHVSSPVPTGT